MSRVQTPEEVPVQLRYGVGDGMHDRGLVIDCIDTPAVTIYIPDGRQCFWRADPA